MAGAGHFVAGNVDIRAVGWLLVGSIPGVLLGSQLTLSMPDRMLRSALATVLLGSGVKLLAPDQLLLLGLVVGAGLTVLIWLERFRSVVPSPKAQAPPSPAGFEAG